MFYSRELLSLRRGKFSILWLAATRGIKFITKRDIIAFDIESSCVELMEYISGAKNTKMSLYLSAQLTFGMCRVFYEKIRLILRDAQDLYSRSLVVFRPQVAQIDDSRLTQQRKPDIMDIEIPLQSYDDFGTLELPGALYDSQLDWQIAGKSFEDSFSLKARVEDITLNEIYMTPKYPTNECTFGEDFRTEFLTDLFGCEQNDHKQGVLEQVPEDLPKTVVAEYTEEQLEAGEQVSQSGVPHRSISTELGVPAMSTEVDLDLQIGQSQSEQPQRLKEGTTATGPLDVSHQLSPNYTVKEHSEKTVEFTEPVVQPVPGSSVTNYEASSQTLCNAEQREPVVEEASTSVPSGAKKARFEEEMGALPVNMSDIPNDPSLLIAPTGTAGTPLARSSAEEPQLRPPCAASSAKRQLLPRRVEITRPTPLHLTDLRPSLLPPVAPRAGRGKRKATSHILVDDPIEMTTADLRANLTDAKEFLLRRADVLAPPSSLTHPRRLLSLSVPRLLALPANWETALSVSLGDCWKSKRRLCEALSPIDLLEVERPQPSKSSLEAVRESDLEASKEEARAHGTSSFLLPPSVSSLIGTSALDMTIQQSAQEAKETSATVSAEAGQPSKRPVILEEEEEQHQQEKVKEPVEAVTAPPVPVAEEFPTLLKTTVQPPQEMPEEPPRFGAVTAPPVPVTEEFPTLLETTVQPPQEMPEEPPLVVTQEKIPPVVSSTAENLETDIQILASEDSLNKFLEQTFKSGVEVLEFSQLVPPSVPRKVAAKALHHLLCLLKKRKVRVSQPTPFGPIALSLRS